MLHGADLLRLKLIEHTLRLKILVKVPYLFARVISE